MTEPFFSVCIPATDREETIVQTLSSVAKQTCRDFEVVLTLRNCSDDTPAVVDRFFDSEMFAQNPFEYSITERDDSVTTVEDWNDPLEEACGRYVAMLEGDDQFTADHLANAKESLKETSDVGVYSTSSQINTRSESGRLSSHEFVEMIYSFRDVPAPSEAIFRRVSLDGTPYRYNTNDFVYAPEIDLYLRIALDGYESLFDRSQEVIRDTTGATNVELGWEKFHDRFVVLDKYRREVTADRYVSTRQSILDDALRTYLESVRRGKRPRTLHRELRKRFMLSELLRSLVRVGVTYATL